MRKCEHCSPEEPKPENCWCPGISSVLLLLLCVWAYQQPCWNTWVSQIFRSFSLFTPRTNPSDLSYICFFFSLFQESAFSTQNGNFASWWAWPGNADFLFATDIFLCCEILHTWLYVFGSWLQETLLNLLLRNYLHYNLYDQAEKLRSKAPRFEAHSNQQVIHLLIPFFVMQLLDLLCCRLSTCKQSM